jgi:crotonobetainyl-CoA:carnitine CoA-transferase CaiB-like acyl-CoA transferase
MRRYPRAELAAKLEAIGLPFAPIAKPWDLLSDPHLKASGGLMATQLPNGQTAHIPALPIALDGKRLPKRSDPPRIGEHTRALLAAAGLAPAEIDALLAQRVVA